MSKIKDYFIAKKTKKQSDPKSEFIKDLNKAVEISSDFKLKLDYTVAYDEQRKQHITRELEHHNFEVCFVPTVWDMLSRTEKIACIMELSKKYCKTPLDRENFIYDKEHKEFLQLDSKNVYINGCMLDEISCLEIMLHVLDYENNINHYRMMSKVEKYHSLDDFKNLDEIKYFVVNCLNNLPKDLQQMILLSSPLAKSGNECNEKILNIFYNVKTYNKEFEQFYSNLSNEINHKLELQKDVFRDNMCYTQREQDELNLKTFYKLTKTYFNNYSYDDLKQRFLEKSKEEEM